MPELDWLLKSTMMTIYVCIKYGMKSSKIRWAKTIWIFKKILHVLLSVNTASSKMFYFLNIKFNVRFLCVSLWYILILNVTLFYACMWWNFYLKYVLSM